MKANKIKLRQSVIVSDPCYTLGTWCQAKIDNVRSGNFNVFCKKFEAWGLRPSLLLAVHEDYMGKELFFKEYDGEIGVDSGQAGIFSAENFRKNPDIITKVPTVGYDGKDLSWLDALSKDDNSEEEQWYIKISKLTLTEKQWGLFPTGVVSRSGLGDGGYTLYLAEDEEQNVVGLCLDYLIEEAEDGEELVTEYYKSL